MIAKSVVPHRYSISKCFAKVLSKVEFQVETRSAVSEASPSYSTPLICECAGPVEEKRDWFFALKICFPHTENIQAGRVAGDG